MTKFLILIFLFPFVLTGQVDKQEAIIAFKEIVKCYYDKDCSKYYSCWADSVSTLNKDTNWRYPSSKLIGSRKTDCSHFGEGAIKETKTFDNYLSNYSIEAVSYSEFKNGDRNALLKKWDTIKKSNEIGRAHV